MYETRFVLPGTAVSAVPCFVLCFVGLVYCWVEISYRDGIFDLDPNFGEGCKYEKKYDRIIFYTMFFSNRFDLL